MFRSEGQHGAFLWLSSTVWRLHLCRGIRKSASFWSFKIVPRFFERLRGRLQSVRTTSHSWCCRWSLAANRPKARSHLRVWVSSIVFSIQENPRNVSLRSSQDFLGNILITLTFENRDLYTNASSFKLEVQIIVHLKLSLAGLSDLWSKKSPWASCGWRIDFTPIRLVYLAKAAWYVILQKLLNVVRDSSMTVNGFDSAWILWRQEYHFYHLPTECMKTWQ